MNASGKSRPSYIVERMTPEEYENEGANLCINYSFAPTPFGDILIASTHKGICSLEFIEDRIEAYNNLRLKFPRAHYDCKCDFLQQDALSIFTQNQSKVIKLHLKGTDFQFKVWKALLSIPLGNMTTYGKIAKMINNPSAYRAVGTAVGNNPVALLIPCHRVVCASGEIGNYRWGTARKRAIIDREADKINLP